MTPAATTVRKLQTADERRVDVLDAAMAQFAKRGYYGTPTAEIAKAAGISQAYLFRLYPTKQDLFVASTERCFDAVVAEFRRVAAQHAGDKEAMGAAMAQRYVELIADRDMLLGQLHAYAAGDDPVIRDAVRRAYGRLVEMVRETTGASDDELRSFFAMGLLITVTAALEIGELDEPWARALDCTVQD
jgi:AcrR family transcriptional regulator